VKDFVNSVKERAVGTEVSRSLTPGQAFVKIVQAELESLMGRPTRTWRSMPPRLPWC